MSITITSRGQIEKITLVAATETNVCGTADTGVGQPRTIGVTVIGAGTVYFKKIVPADSLTGKVSSTDYHQVLTSADGEVPFFLAPQTSLVCISAGTPDIAINEIIYVC